MADIFYPSDLARLLANKHVVFLGGSVVRGLYRDMMWLINSASLIPHEVLGSKGEKHFPDLEKTAWRKGKVSRHVVETFHQDNRDSLLEYKGLSSGRSYIEPRMYHNKEHNITLVYRFISRVWSKELSDWLNNYEDVFGSQIDFLLVNSCLWDINRWGPTGPEDFKANLSTMVSDVPGILAPGGHCVWLTSPPGSKEIDSKGMNVPGLDFQCLTTRYNVVEANWLAGKVAASGGISVLDLHYHLQTQTARRNKDGIHWSSSINRLVTNLILTHLVLLLDGPSGLPGRVSDNYALELVKLRAEVAKKIFTKAEMEEKLLMLDKLVQKTVLQETEDKMTAQLKDKAKSSLLEMKGKVEGRSKVEEFKSRVAMSRGQHRFRPYEGIRHSQKIMQRSPSLDDGTSQSVDPQRWGNTLNLPDPEFSSQPQDNQGQHSSMGGDGVTAVQRRRMLMKNLYQSKVQEMAREKNLNNQDLYSIKQEVVMEVMNMQNRLQDQNWSYSNGGVGLENNFQNSQGRMGMGEVQMGMGQFGMGMGQFGLGMGQFEMSQFGTGTVQGVMGMGQTGMQLGQNGMGMGLGNGVMGFGNGNGQAGMGVNKLGLWNGQGGAGFGDFQFPQGNVQGGMGWGQCGGGGGFWS